jgi:hypothetical protein
MSTITDTQTKRICIINRLSASNQLSQDKDIIPALRAIQKQLNGEFKHYWGVSAKLYYCPPGITPPKNMWALYLLDTSDSPGALGYHDANAQGIPQGKVFVKTAKNSGAKWSVTTSHEILEMLIDPWGMTSFFQDFTSGMRRLVAMEVCDPCEADKYAYQIDGIWVSNFVTPYWYHPFEDIAELDNQIKYDYKGLINKSFTTLPGCHQSYYYISGAPQGIANNSWSSKNFKLGDVVEIVSNVDRVGVPALKKRGWVISFKTPDPKLVEKFNITKDEVLKAIEDAFNPPEGSRRDIRFKGLSNVRVNDSQVHKDEEPGEVLNIDPAF